MAHQIKDIDQAWEDLLGGKTITAGPVTFFQEMPHEEVVPQRVFPSISMTLVDIVPDSNRRTGEQEGERCKVGETTNTTPRTSDMVPVPTPYRLVYQIETWAKDLARDDRELQQIMLNIGENHTLLDPGTGKYVWCFKTGFINADLTEEDVRLYHKIYTYDVLVEIADDTDIVQVPQAGEFRFTFKQNTAAPPKQNAKGLSTDTPVIDGPLVTDIEVVVDDS